ncbi:MAG: hypothetical protein CMB80_08060 [Flammeovirgaceae bacterium]|nr:hypothetical protein [Flammeovirgaceae bacterium]|tara:strand:+ start:263 stop:580 length:318 start_codon:yes stop_codon:yes gene_type:complete
MKLYGVLKTWNNKSYHLPTYAIYDGKDYYSCKSPKFGVYTRKAYFTPEAHFSLLDQWLLVEICAVRPDDNYRYSCPARKVYKYNNSNIEMVRRTNPWFFNGYLDA